MQNITYPSPGFPTYNLYLAKPDTPMSPPNLLAQLSFSRYTYLIIDERFAYKVPELGVYFVPGEPTSLFIPQDGHPILYGRLGKFNKVLWAVKVFQSNNYSIYRFIIPHGAASYEHKWLTPLSRGGRVPQGKLQVTSG
jgi:hypothetical protein